VQDNSRFFTNELSGVDLFNDWLYNIYKANYHTRNSTEVHIYMDSGQFSGNNYYKVKRDYNKIIKIGLLILAAVILIILASTCFYTVNDKQRGVITTFGKVTGIADAGIHFKIPFGIQHVDKVDVNIYQKIEIGYRSKDSGGGNYDVVENESKMITGDYNIINVDFFVEYRISDPVKYLYNSYSPELILKNLTQSQIRNIVGSADVDEALTTGKAEMQTRIFDLVTAELEKYDIGLTLTDIKIQDSEPPTQEVIEAFKNVETAKQGAETAINQAKAYQNAQLPLAQAEADKLIQNAEFLKQSRINEATEKIAMFNAMYNEYRLNPDITRIRMYYEAIELMLPDVKVYIDVSDSSGMQKLLPLESLVSTGEAAAAKGGN
jgi:membrane protease subunit HflK